MREVAPSHEVVRFCAFEVDFRNSEVRKHGSRIRLQDQPFRILQILLEHPGDLVNREELQRQIWPADTFVDFEKGLNNAIKRLRDALGDSAEQPQFIETHPRRGYRFIGSVTATNGAGQTQEGSETGDVVVPARSRQLYRQLAIGVVLVLAFVTILFVLDIGGLQQRFIRPSAPVIHSLAVIPFTNLSNDPNQEYFSDGMTDALITDLAQIGSLKVISRTSTIQYKGSKKTLPEIARELNVDGIVEGTVQRSGDRVRITAQLIYGPSDKHVWANSYERDTRDIFALERDVTEDITRQVRAQISAPNRTSGARSQPTNPQALEAYLQGNYHLHKYGRGFGDEEQKKAAEFFRQAIDADPNFAPAYLGLANAHAVMWPSSQDAEIAKQSIEKAAKLDPTSSNAREALGGIKESNWDWSGAEQDYRSAIMLSPNNAQAHSDLCYLLGKIGRTDEAVRECKTAQELDPSQEYLSLALYMFRHDYDGAISIATIALQSDPDIAYLHQELFRFYAAKGMYKESVQELETTATSIGLPKTADRIRRAFTASGYQGAMQQWAKELEVLTVTKQLYAPVNLALAYAILEEKDKAFYWLEQGYAEHDMQQMREDMTLEEVATDPLFAPLRDDPRYKDLLLRMGLPP